MAILIFLSFKFDEFGPFSDENSLYRLKSYFSGRNLMKLANKKTLNPLLFIRWDASQVFFFRNKSFLLTHHHKKFDMWETSQNNSFYVRMEGLPFCSPINENCGKMIYGIWGGALGNHLGEHIGNLRNPLKTSGSSLGMYENRLSS
jgi:hypothetical protein